jgi:hypothetical protein
MVKTLGIRAHPESIFFRNLGKTKELTPDLPEGSS